jgi:hypothetical protein
MGSRANYVVIERGARELYYSHWTADTLARDLFWGPQWGLPFIRQQERTQAWLDDVWCEGAALADLDHKVLLFFGGDDVKYDVLLRRLYLSLLRSVWVGWDVRWAHQGLLDVVDHLGLPRALVLSERNEDFRRVPDAAGEWTNSVVSVRWADGRTRIYPLNAMADYTVYYGEALLPVLRRLDEAGQGRDRLVVASDCTGGAHVDVAFALVDFWLAAPRPEPQERAAGRWPGWEVVWRRDELEAQVSLTDGRLTFDTPPAEKLVADIASMLEYLPGEHHGVRVAEIAAMLGRDGERVDVNPRALVDAPQSVPVEERRRILETALAACAAAKSR